MIDYSKKYPKFFFTRDSLIGAAFLILALFAGLLGGAMMLPFIEIRPSSGIVVSHMLLMAFFVITPGILGGMAYWLLPQSLGAQKMALPVASLIAWLLLAISVIILPLVPVLGLILWSISMVALSIDLIATILEERVKKFRQLSPIVWSFLFSAISLLLMAPIILALIVKGKIDFNSAYSLMLFFKIPEMSFLLLPALGVVAEALSPFKENLTIKLAPYIMGIIGLVAPTLWIQTLFCALPHGFLNYIMPLSQIVPAMVFLACLCSSLWNASFKRGAAPFWALNAMILLFLGGMCSLFIPPSYTALSVLGDISHGHQAIIFGSVMALCAGFYAWLSQLFSEMSKSFTQAGIAHAFLTLSAMLCFMVPQIQWLAITLAGISLLGFSILGFQACFIIKKKQIISLQRSFPKG
ncbi:cbb3-type cytochrome c oxidase subunit I [Aristophania vespae]|uniref:cbb3-type cytochrome c oxidase subunit I n=1 Tax=Aristophania vespae TaxID=2697033 RepID=UPI001F00DDFC|nr:cbb3-type cytochrome c oxidase subunit I [Aristophania vespae]